MKCQWVCAMFRHWRRPCDQWRLRETSCCRVVNQHSRPWVMWAAAVWTPATETRQCTDVNTPNTSDHCTHMLNELYDWQHSSYRPICVQSGSSFHHILHVNTHTHNQPSIYDRNSRHSSTHWRHQLSLYMKCCANVDHYNRVVAIKNEI